MSWCVFPGVCVRGWRQDDRVRFFGKRRMAALATVLDNKSMDAKQRKAAATGLLTRCRYVMLEGASRDNKWSVQFLRCGGEVTRWWLRGVGRCRGWARRGAGC